jgi:hypothetical protein
MKSEDRKDEAPHYAMSREDVVEQFPYGLPAWLQPRTSDSNVVDLKQWRRQREGRGFRDDVEEDTP